MAIVGTLLLGVLAPVRRIAAAVLSLCSDEALFTSHEGGPGYI